MDKLAIQHTYLEVVGLNPLKHLRHKNVLPLKKKIGSIFPVFGQQTQKMGLMEDHDREVYGDRIASD